MRVQYFEYDDRLLAGLRGQVGLLRLFNYLVVQEGGDVEAALEILREMQARGMLGPDVDLDEFREQLEEQNLVREVDGQLQLTPSGERGLRRDALDQIFSSLRGRGNGSHAVPREGAGREPLAETRAYEFGDGVESIDFRRSIANALRRGDEDALVLRESNLEVH